jgi:hypothetical protein
MVSPCNSTPESRTNETDTPDIAAPVLWTMNRPVAAATGATVHDGNPVHSLQDVNTSSAPPSATAIGTQRIIAVPAPA